MNILIYKASHTPLTSFHRLESRKIYIIWCQFCEYTQKQNIIYSLHRHQNSQDRQWTPELKLDHETYTPYILSEFEFCKQMQNFYVLTFVTYSQLNVHVV